MNVYMNLAKLRQLGFDQSFNVPFSRRYGVRCSKCRIGIVDGRPVHADRCQNSLTATCPKEVADWLDPKGHLQRAGLLTVKGLL